MRNKLIIGCLTVIFLSSIFNSCKKEDLTYLKDIELLKSQVSAINSKLDSLSNAIKVVSGSLTNLEKSVKNKIDLTNTRVDSISKALVNLQTQVALNTLNIKSNTSINAITSSISTLNSDIQTISSNLHKTNQDLKSKTDSLIGKIEGSLSKIKLIEASLTNSYVTNDVLGGKVIEINKDYNNILSKYLELLNLVSATVSESVTNGAVFKGSFLRGSLLNFYELDKKLNQTGRSFNSTIKDDYGNFTLKAQNLNGKLVRVVGDGFYWNEVLNENSSSRITLTALCLMGSNETVNVNVLTHLERPRVEYLYNIKGLSFESAKSQAVREVLKAFGYENTGIERAEKVGVVGKGNESKILLAISTLMQGYRTESEVTQILNDFAEDLEKDGLLTSASIGNDLETHLNYVDTATVLNNFKIKYRKLYNADTVNSVDMRFIKTFQNNTVYTKDKDLIDYPAAGSAYPYPNVLNNDVILPDKNSAGCANCYNLTFYAKIMKGMKLKVEITNENGTSLTFNDMNTKQIYLALAGNNNLGWKLNVWPENGNISKPLIEAGSLTNELRASIFTPGVYRINFFENGSSTPNRTKTFTLR